MDKEGREEEKARSFSCLLGVVARTIVVRTDGIGQNDMIDNLYLFFPFFLLLKLSSLL